MPNLIKAFLASFLIGQLVAHPNYSTNICAAEDVATVDTRSHVPDEAARREATKAVKEVFKTEIAAAKQPTDKLLVIEKLIQQAEQPSDNLSERYALLAEAMNLAAEVGDPAKIAAVTTVLSKTFQVDRYDALLKGFEAANGKSRLPTANSPLVIAMLQHAEQASIDDRFDIAKKFGDAAVVASRKTNNPTLLKTAVDTNKELAARKERWDRVNKAYEVLSLNPDDPEANLTVGRELCFSKGEWELGFKYLTKSSNSSLADLAKQSQAVPTDPAAMVEIAEAWLKAAETAKAAAKTDFLYGAQYWFSRAVVDLSGLTQVKVEQRLEQLNKSLPIRPYRSLFNGQDLTGWENRGGDMTKWTVVGGAIIPQGTTETALVTARKDYQNFHFRAEMKIPHKHNGFVIIRSQRDRAGYKIKLNGDRPGDAVHTGSLYSDGTLLKEVSRNVVKPDTWFSLEIIAQGSRIQVKINGGIVSEAIDSQNRYPSGAIGFEYYAFEQKTAYRRIEIREMPTSR